MSVSGATSPRKKAASCLALSPPKSYSTMPKQRHHRSPSKRKRLFHIEGDVASEGSGLESLETVEDICVTQWKVDDLASQLTLISGALFRDLLPLDLASLNWYNPKMRISPDSQRVNAITSRFNYDGQWTISEILKQETPRQRAYVLSHFLRLAERLFQLNNFHSSYAVFSALLSSPISRLEQTESHLTKRDREIRDQLSAVFCSDNNWKSFREYQEKAGYPRLPHIGFYKTDLIHAYHACTNVNERHRRLKAIETRVFELYSRSNYGFLEDIPVIQTYLKSFRYMEELQKFVDDSNTKISKLLEPDPTESSSKATPHEQPKITVSSKARPSKTNLIDDSNIEELLADDAFLLTSGQSLNRKNIGNLSLPSNMAVLQRHYDWQGILERKNVVKNGRFSFVPRWKPVWAAVWSSNFFVFKPKSPFRTSERSHFDGTPCAVYTLTEWKMEAVGDDRLELRLSSPDHAFIMKLKAHTVTEFREWIKYLKAAVGGSSNLIKFDM
ncbi:hypothetical protein RvY_15649 [Ramazzottius varieornatus]|uniref:PH domain-containing protein n=1 Tax=Ramazzottius varieornatus TaxID=947166 RepID=A0A1D1VWU3_RAMVA|nr:hypothetical protein RvY_15649 [Ramazzottius varieornatus]